MRPSISSAGAASSDAAARFTSRSLKSRIEREHRDVDLGADLVQQRAGLERFEALIAQRLAQRVDFDHDLAERIARVGVAAAQRVVAFAQCFEHVRERLQRADHARAA